MFYRGVVFYRFLGEGWGTDAAAAACSVLFGLMHLLGRSAAGVQPSWWGYTYTTRLFIVQSPWGSGFPFFLCVDGTYIRTNGTKRCVTRDGKEKH